jgi:trk system potassium uptake protein TrkA
MQVIVVGCGRVGSELAYGLYKRGHKVVVVDQDPDAFRNLPSDFRGRTLAGDVLSQELLVRAGIERADALAAVTPDDAVNAVVAHVAKETYEVPIVVVRDYDPRKRSLHEAFGHQVVSPSVWGAQRIEELLSGSALHTVFSAGNGEVEIYEFSVPAAWEGKRLREAVSDPPARVIALTRAGRASIPDPDSKILAGDVVNVAATQAGIEQLQEAVRQAEEG